MQPELDRVDVVRAFRQFDQKHRKDAEWKEWESNKSHKYAIRYKQRTYPVKKIIELATGVPVSEFSGGAYAGHANRLMEKVGFEIVQLRGTNPDWVTDELILALDLYLRFRPNPPDKSSKEIERLGDLLRQMGAKLFLPENRSETFRNANGVYMKLMNFRRLDPLYTSTGKKGLSAGAKEEEAVWKEYASDPERCRSVANAIEASIGISNDLTPALTSDPDLEEAAEGQLLTRQHISRERNRKLIERKKSKVQQELGRLVCEVCGFDFRDRYGERGEGFIECHHTKPVASLTPDGKTHINDLALICANCHRVIHRRKPWLTMDEVRNLLR